MSSIESILRHVRDRIRSSAAECGLIARIRSEVGDFAYVHDAEIDARTARHTVQQAFHELD